jgi:hypothetical protein
LALLRFCETVPFHSRELAMLRTFKIALFSAMMMAAACKKSEKPAATTAEMTKAADPAKPAEPADPAAKPAGAAPAGAAPAGAAPAGAGSNTELENKGIAMMQRMADMFAGDAKDCDRLAADIKGFIAQNKELLGQLMAMEKTLSDDQKAAFEARNKPVQEAMMTKMTPAMEACRDNKSVEAAMKEFPTD